MTAYEIEKKFLIRRPDESLLMSLTGCEKSEIEQIYLENDEGMSERIRMRKTDGKVLFYHTLKIKISDMRRIETENLITQAEYEELKKRAYRQLNAIYKERYCIPYAEHTLEIDVFPFWQNNAYLEIELKSENEEYKIPDFIEIIRDVTNDKRYTNHSLAFSVPVEI